MNHEILYKPSYAMLSLQLSPGETVVAEAGAMVAMSSDMGVKTSLSTRHGGTAGFFGRLWGFIAGLAIALIRRVLGGESFFINRFSPGAQGGELLLSPTVTGDIVHLPMNGQSVMIQAGAFLASTTDISTKVRFSGLRGLFSGEGLFLLQCSGQGDLWVNSYGGIECIEIDGKFSVDTGHIVAFDSSLDWSIRAVGGLKSTLLSGEGLIVEFSGKGKVWIQSRQISSFVNWLLPQLPA